MDNPELFYHSLLRFGVQPGLERINALLGELGNPEKGLKAVHVAGTNGKGTTSTLLAYILREAGYNTGLYTSPYIIDFRERIQFNSRMISEKELACVTQAVESAVKRVNGDGLFPTEFEAITAAAFLYFKQMNCDVAVLECGLGGRFDATNVLDEVLCSIIVSISFDHMAILGDTLDKIAWEKAGIIKKSCPVITSVNQNNEAMRVLDSQASLVGAELYTVNDRAMLEILSEDITGTTVRYNGSAIKIPFCGRHQVENASLAFAAAEILKNNGMKISDRALCRGTERAFLPARTEIISNNPLIILDGSHNEGSTHALADVLERHLHGKKILAVMGMMADKDISAALSTLVGHFSTVITVKPSNPRSEGAEKLAEIVEALGVTAYAAASPEQGVEKALSLLQNFDALVVCGSLYLAADVRELLKTKNNFNL